jgi:hypothetical protein
LGASIYIAFSPKMLWQEIGGDKKKRNNNNNNKIKTGFRKLSLHIKCVNIESTRC